MHLLLECVEGIFDSFMARYPQKKVICVGCISHGLGCSLCLVVAGVIPIDLQVRRGVAVCQTSAQAANKTDNVRHVAGEMGQIGERQEIIPPIG
ncbi:hypothetical protein Trydic_g19277 [Trypoxylus dichotomus]